MSEPGARKLHPRGDTLGAGTAVRGGAAVGGGAAARGGAAVGLAIAAATVGVIPVFLTGALGVQLRHDLHLGSADIGMAVAVFFGSSALCSVTGGRLAERLGALTMMRVASVFSLASMIGLGVTARDLWSLLALLVVGGISNGLVQPAVNLYLADRVRSRRQGLAFGIKQAGIPTATLLSGLAVPALALTAGWQAAYLAGAGLVVGVMAALFASRSATVPGRQGRPGRPATSRGSATGTTGRLAPRAGAPAVSAAAMAGVRVGAEPLAPPGAGRLGLWPLVLMAAGMAGPVAASTALGAFVVPSAVDHGVAAGYAGLLSAMGSVVGLSARVGQGWRADAGVHEGVPAAVRHLATVVGMVSAGVLGYLGLASGIHALLVPGVVLAYGAGWGFNGLFNLAVVRAYAHGPARATGVTQIGTYAGGMVGPLCFGILVDRSGYGAAWAMCAGLAAVGGTTLLLARRHLGRAAPARQLVVSPAGCEAPP